MQCVIWKNLDEKEKRNILIRPMQKNAEDICAQASAIIDAIKQQGDKALLEFTHQFDHVILGKIKISTDELEQAKYQISSEIAADIEYAYRQIYKYHQSQLLDDTSIETEQGVYCERQLRPIDRIGLYVPGGTAPLVSTVLMLGVPSQIASCPRRLLCTPPDQSGNLSPYILFAAELCGITEIYKVGGAQAIAALAYGTETILKVDKIFGPGNRWVTQAKILVSLDPFGANIDLPAGPSELLIIADEYAEPDFLAADLLSQAEHGADTQVILLTTSQAILNKVELALTKQLEKLPRKQIISQALINSRFILVDDILEAINISNEYAPEHLALQVSNPEQYISFIKNAGALFLGPWSAVSLGDYITGSNHVLPSSGFARSLSGLSVIDFMKSMSIQKITKAGLKIVGSRAQTLANIEGLDAHNQAIQIRLQEANNE